jgi:O-antigen biosynthesis protein
VIEETGERYLPWMRKAHIHYEHLSRCKMASQYVANKTVLDLGCGEGYGSHLLATTARSVTGVDIDTEVVSHASSKYVRDGLEYLRGSMTAIPIKGAGLFDVIVCFEALEHITAHDQLLGEVTRLLKADGLFIVSTPNVDVYSRIYRNKYHLRELTLEQFRSLLCGEFQNIKVLGQAVLPASLIYGIDGDHQTSVVHLIAKEKDGFVFTPFSGLSPSFYIAFASNAPMKAPPPGDFVLVDVSNELMNQKQTEIQELRRLLADGTGIKCVIETLLPVGTKRRLVVARIRRHLVTRGGL